MSIKNCLCSILAATALQLNAADFSDANYPFSDAIKLADKNKPQVHKKENIVSWTFLLADTTTTPPSQIYPSQTGQQRNVLGPDIITNSLPAMQLPGQKKTIQMYIQLQILSDGTTRNILTYQTSLNEIRELGRIASRNIYSQRALKTAPAIILIYQSVAGDAHMMPDEIRESSREGQRIYLVQGKTIISELEDHERKGVLEQKIADNAIIHLGNKNAIDYFLIGEKRAEEVFQKRMGEMIRFYNSQKNNAQIISSDLLSSSSWDEALTRR